MCAAVDVKKVANMCVPFHCIPTKYFQDLSVDTSLDYKLDLKKFSDGSRTNSNEPALMVMPGYGSNYPVTCLSNQHTRTYANSYDMNSVSYSNHVTVPTTYTSSVCQRPTYLTSSQHLAPVYYETSTPRQPITMTCRDKQCPTTSRAIETSRPFAYCTRRAASILNTVPPQPQRLIVPNSVAHQSVNPSLERLEAMSHRQLVNPSLPHTVVTPSKPHVLVNHSYHTPQPHSHINHTPQPHSQINHTPQPHSHIHHTPPSHTFANHTSQPHSHIHHTPPSHTFANHTSQPHAVNLNSYPTTPSRPHPFVNPNLSNHLHNSATMSMNHVTNTMTSSRHSEIPVIPQTPVISQTQETVSLRRSRRTKKSSSTLQAPPAAVIDLTQDSPTLPTHPTLPTSTQHHRPNLFALIDSCDVGVADTIGAEKKPSYRQPFTGVSDLRHAQQAPTTFVHPHAQFAESATVAGLTPQNTLHAQPTPRNNTPRQVNQLMPSSASSVPHGSSGVPTSGMNTILEHSANIHNTSTFIPTPNNNMSVFTPTHLPPYQRWCSADGLGQMSIQAANLRQQAPVCEASSTQQSAVDRHHSLPYNTRKRTREACNNNVPSKAKRQCVLQSTENIINSNANLPRTALTHSVPDNADKLTTSWTEKSILTSAENFDSFLNLYLFSASDNAATPDLALSQNHEAKHPDPNLNGCNSKRLIRDNTSLSRSVQARAS